MLFEYEDERVGFSAEELYEIKDAE